MDDGQFPYQEWARRYRVPEFGRFDGIATAAQVGVPLYFRDLTSWESCGDVVSPSAFEHYRGAWGIYLHDGPPRIVIEERLEGSRRDFIIAHELGHHRLGRHQPIDRSWPEIYADWLARELLLPQRWLEGRTLREALRLGEEVGVSRELVLCQLARAGRLTEIFGLASGVIICRDCGDRDPGEYWCRCRQYRQIELPNSYQIYWDRDQRPIEEDG